MMSKEEYLKNVARETAHLAYSSRMSGILYERTKEIVINYFVYKFPINELWNDSAGISKNFDVWHEERVIELGNLLRSRRIINGKLKYETSIRKPKKYRSRAIAAKCLNLFLHHLMKYEECRPLYTKLHLPLDREVFKRIQKIVNENEDSDLSKISTKLLNGIKSPYSMTYGEYYNIQGILLSYLGEFNQNSKIKLTSRAELNAVLWAAQKRKERTG